jgi:hypothetical protein
MTGDVEHLFGPAETHAAAGGHDDRAKLRL